MQYSHLLEIVSGIYCSQCYSGVCVCVCAFVWSEFYWANYATGLGAALHELGHTFDLAHSPTGIMSRGFDDIHRFFTVVTPMMPFRGMTSSCHIQRSCSPAPCSATQSPVRRPTVRHIISIACLHSKYLMDFVCIAVVCYCYFTSDEDVWQQVKLMAAVLVQFNY